MKHYFIVYEEKDLSTGRVEKKNDIFGGPSPVIWLLQKIKDFKGKKAFVILNWMEDNITMDTLRRYQEAISVKMEKKK